jgi:hypothetical protein
MKSFLIGVIIALFAIVGLSLGLYFGLKKDPILNIGDIQIKDKTRQVTNNVYETSDSIELTLTGDHDESNLLVWSFSINNKKTFTNIPNDTLGNTIDFVIPDKILSNVCNFKVEYEKDSNSQSTSSQFSIQPNFTLKSGLGFKPDMLILQEGETNFTLDISNELTLSSDVSDYILFTSTDNETWTETTNISSINLETGFVTWPILFQDETINEPIWWKLTTSTNTLNNVELVVQSSYSFIIDTVDGTKSWIADAKDDHIYKTYETGTDVKLVFLTNELAIDGTVVFTYSVDGKDGTFISISNSGTPVINGKTATSTWVIPDDIWTSSFVLKGSDDSETGLSSLINITPIIEWNVPHGGDIVNVWSDNAPALDYINTLISGDQLYKILEYKFGLATLSDGSDVTYFNSVFTGNNTVRWGLNYSNLGFTSLSDETTKYFVIQIKGTSSTDIATFVTGTKVTFKASQFSLQTHTIRTTCGDTTSTDGCSPGKFTNTSLITCNTNHDGKESTFVCASNGGESNFGEYTNCVFNIYETDQDYCTDESVDINLKNWLVAILPTETNQVKLYHYNSTYIDSDYGKYADGAWRIISHDTSTILGPGMYIVTEADVILSLTFLLEELDGKILIKQFGTNKCAITTSDSIPLPGLGAVTFKSENCSFDQPHQFVIY